MHVIVMHAIRVTLVLPSCHVLLQVWTYHQQVRAGAAHGEGGVCPCATLQCC